MFFFIQKNWYSTSNGSLRAVVIKCRPNEETGREYLIHTICTVSPMDSQANYRRPKLISFSYVLEIWSILSIDFDIKGF